MFTVTLITVVLLCLACLCCYLPWEDAEGPLLDGVRFRVVLFPVVASSLCTEIVVGIYCIPVAVFFAYISIDLVEASECCGEERVVRCDTNDAVW